MVGQSGGRRLRRDQDLFGPPRGGGSCDVTPSASRHKDNDPTKGGTSEGSSPPWERVHPIIN